MAVEAKILETGKNFKWLKRMVLLVTLVVFLAPTESFAKDYTTSELEKTAHELISWRQESGEQLFAGSDLENAGQTSADWFAFAVGRFGIPANYQDYQSLVSKNVVERYQTAEKLSRSKATEWHRIGLSLLATGGDPEKVTFTEESNEIVNLIADGTYDRAKTQPLATQGNNGLIWALLLLDSLNYEVPATAETTRQELVREILATQNKDGGFPLARENSNIDITGMAMAALAPYYNSEERHTYVSTSTEQKVTKTVRQVIDGTLIYISKQQLASGGFSESGVENPESTVQVLVGLNALGINPLLDKRFIKNGHNMIDHIMTFRQADGGFIHSFELDSENESAQPDESNNMASEQVLYGLVSTIRQQKGMRHLYDLRPELATENKEDIQNLIKEIDRLSGVTSGNKEEVASLYLAFLNLPLENQRFVSNYASLVALLEQHKIPVETTYTSLNTGKAEKGHGVITSIESGEVIDLKTQWELTETDIETYQGLKKPIALSDKATVLALLQKYKQQEDKNAYQTEITTLAGYAKELTDQLNELEELNTVIETTLYPFEELKFYDYPKIKKIMAKVDNYSDEDRQLIFGYEDLNKAYVQTHNLYRSLLIAIVIGGVVLIGSIILVMRQRKRKREKAKKYLLIDDEDDEENAK